MGGRSRTCYYDNTARRSAANMEESTRLQCMRRGREAGRHQHGAWHAAAAAEKRLRLLLRLINSPVDVTAAAVQRAFH